MVCSAPPSICTFFGQDLGTDRQGIKTAAQPLDLFWPGIRLGPTSVPICSVSIRGHLIPVHSAQGLGLKIPIVAPSAGLLIIAPGRGLGGGVQIIPVSCDQDPSGQHMAIFRIQIIPLPILGILIPAQLHPFFGIDMIPEVLFAVQHPAVFQIAVCAKRPPGVISVFPGKLFDKKAVLAPYLVPGLVSPVGVAQAPAFIVLFPSPG